MNKQKRNKRVTYAALPDMFAGINTINSVVAKVVNIFLKLQKNGGC